MYTFDVVGETHAHDYFEVILFNNDNNLIIKIYSILRYVIPHKLRHV